MNSLTVKPVFKRVPLVRYSALTKRENKISVQLLRDFPQYGSKGEIVQVLPGLMRNKLYPNNGAAYVIPEAGLHPRIPVVKREARRVVKPQEPVRQETSKVEEKKAKKQSEKIEPVEIDGLLFNLPSETSTLSGSIKPSVGGYSMITLNVTLGTLRFNSESLPLSKRHVSQHISGLVGFSIPETDVSFSKKKDQQLDEIVEKGEYQLTIKQEGSQSTVSKKIVIS